MSTSSNTPNEQWAVVEIMGHDQTAGRITMENGMLRVDVPEGDSFRTEYLGLAALFRVRLVSEEIARACSPVTIDARPYDAPIVTREQYQDDMRRAEREVSRLREHVRTLEHRLTAVSALPEHTEEAKYPEYPDDFGDEDGDEDDDEYYAFQGEDDEEENED